MQVYSSSQRLMASQSPEKSPGARPNAPRIASFSHHNDRDTNDSLRPPKRAQTYQSGSPVEDRRGKPQSPSAFENNEDSDPEDGIEITRASVELDVLPIELVSLTDR